ncbi:MAG: rhamnulokinase [Clostridia bacterium]|nr:rhamnulokinase [Clostridia bacterium]
MSKNVLAFDFGASSGRAIIGSYDDNKISLKEVHRFPNDPVYVGGTLYWDVLRLLFEIKQGILAAHHNGGFDSIGIDTWGVDFGLIDKDGRLLENPVHYRDSRTDTIMEEVFQIVPKEEIYQKTGTQFMNFNTIFQLYYLAKYRKDLLDRADCFLLFPDLLAYFLTGEKTVEYTHASTTQLINAETREWDFDLIDKLGIPRRLFPNIVKPGTQKGMLSKEICDELGVPSVPVCAVGSHDTASAVMAVPSEKEDFIYISCGTWSLFGTEAKEPYINEKSQKYNLTNEGGYNDTIRFLKNIMGLWLIQESRRQWIREGFAVTYGDLEKEALAEEAFKCFIDSDYPIFGKPGNLPLHIKEYCKNTNQYVPERRGEVMRCIYESLALKYRYAFENIQDVTGKKYEVIHIVGGGTKDNLLCQMTANSCGVDVVAGPIEATALGNVAAQLIAGGDIKDLKEARQIIKNSETTTTYSPKDVEAWDKAYQEFLKLDIQ